MEECEEIDMDKLDIIDLTENEMACWWSGLLDGQKQMTDFLVKSLDDPCVTIDALKLLIPQMYARQVSVNIGTKHHI